MLNSFACAWLALDQNKIIMATVTYESLQTESLITINYDSISHNFKTIDSFIKNFPTFQRKLLDLEKMQKATAQDLSNFKISTQNTFSTINDMVEARSSTSKGSGLAQAEEIKEIKKSFKEVKTFITENTREQHEAQQVRDKQAEQVKQALESKIASLKEELQEKENSIRNLQEQNQSFRQKFVTKVYLEKTHQQQAEANAGFASACQQMSQVRQLLDTLNVKEMKETIESFQKDLGEEFNELKRKFKLKADYSDVLKLEDMLLNIINFSHENSFRKLADKNETKKALVFLEKKINKLLMSMYGDEEGDREGLLVTKGFKCISCTKDLGEMEGKLDKYKAWSVFPVKDTHIKDRYSGFGAGFQTIVQTTVGKKGGDISYDEKGRMTTPYNLTREVQGTLLKPSQSQSKLNKDSSAAKYQSMGSRQTSPTKPMQLETNYMSSYGRSSDGDIDLKAEYLEKERGLMAYIKFVMESSQDK